MRRILPLLLILGGCGSKSGDAPALAGEKLGLPVVPDAIANQLGNANVVMAFDLHGLDGTKLAEAMPPGLDCVREMISSVGVAVIGSGDATNGFVTGLPEGATKKCIESLAPMFGGKTATEDGKYTLTIGDTKASLVWADGMVKIEEVGHPVKPGPPSAALLAQLKGVPADAKGWIVSGGFVKYKITRALVYLQSTGDKWHVFVDDEASEPHVAKTWTEDMVRGFKEGAAQKGVKFEDSWVTVTEPTPTTAHLVADIPSNIFSTGHGANE